MSLEPFLQEEKDLRELIREKGRHFETEIVDSPSGKILDDNRNSDIILDNRKTVLIPPYKHQWKFVSSCIDCVGAKLRNSFLIEKWEKSYLQELLISSNYFSDTKFTWISYVIYYGLKNDQNTKFNRISTTYKELQMSKELDMRVLLTADENNVNMLMDFFKIAFLDSLIEAGVKYRLISSAVEVLRRERAKLGYIPDWALEMEEHPEIMLNKYETSLPSHR